MTHSGPLAAIAVDFTAEIGIDLELSDRAVEFEWLVHVLSARERQQADGNVPRRDELLALWVRKEAAVKALGRGLSFPLNEVDVGLGKAAGVWRELTVEERGTMRVLNFIDLDLASDSAATLARIGSATSVRIRAISVLD
jgi:4'-phosphopantetheinyl transferase